MTPPVHVLLGSQVIAAGEVRLVDGEGLAAVCTPGTVVTVDPLREPNEDAAVVATAPDGTWLAAVVDGNGTTAGTEAVAGHVAACAPGLLRAPHPDVVGVLAGAVEALHEVRRAGAHATGASVTLVVGRGRRLWTWTRGDTAAVVVGPGRAWALGGVVPPPLAPAPVPGRVEARRGAEDAVVLASDGFFGALGAAWVDVMESVGGQSPARAARTLTAAALARGADDAVTVVVVAPDGPGH